MLFKPRMKKVRRFSWKKLGLLLWVSLFWIVAVTIIVELNYLLYISAYTHTPLWGAILVGVSINAVVIWSAFDALMAFTYDMLYPGMDEER